MILCNRKLTKHLSTNNILPAKQFRFRQNKSTLQLITNITNTARINFNYKRNTTLVTLVIKAFNTVNTHTYCKDYSNKHPSPLATIIDSYLTQRTFKVIVTGTHSDKLYTKTGVPQGSLLGPTLFNIYLHHIPKTQYKSNP